MINELTKIKEDIKSAIIEKGVNITGGMVTYADAINKINSDFPNIEFDGLDYDDDDIANVYALLQLKINGVVGSEKFYMQGEGYSESPVLFPRKYNGDNASYVYYCAGNIVYVTRMDTSNFTTFEYWFGGCQLITYMPELDCGKVENFRGALYDCSNLTHIGGFKNLGKVENIEVRYAFAGCPLLSRNACVNIFNNLYDRASVGYSIKYLEFEPEVIARLSDEDIAIATNKGWDISAY